MTTGPQHYQQAEGFLNDARSENYDSGPERYYLAAAQVHATLALAAAVGTLGEEGQRSPEDISEWERIAGEYTRQSRLRSDYEKTGRTKRNDAESAGCA